jgi:hypothetical protein
MVVRTQSDGRIVTGIYIGTRNARRNFPRHTQSVELLLGHLHIDCALPPDFRRGQPHICDRRLADWLESKIFHGRSCRAPVPMALLPAGKNTFRLLPLPLPPASLNRFVQTGTVPSPAHVPAAKPPLSATMRKTSQNISYPVNFAR